MLCCEHGEDIPSKKKASDIYEEFTILEGYEGDGQTMEEWRD